MEDFEQRYRGWHTKLSIIKSIIRILTSAIVIVLVGIDHNIILQILIMLFAFGYGIAEIVGILEEF
jgi:hypothetical protein